MLNNSIRGLILKKLKPWNKNALLHPKGQTVWSTSWGGQRRSKGLLVGLKYGGDLVGTKAVMVAVKTLQKPGKDVTRGSGEVKTGLAGQWFVGLVLFYFKTLFSVSRLYSVDGRMTSEWWWIGKDLVWSDHGLILRYNPGLAWRYWGKSRETSARTAGRRGRHLNPGPSEYEAGVLTTWLTRLVKPVIDKIHTHT
jgi:hypothetical protein